ncbi:MAG: acetyl-CoA acetyltransferase, partial [Acidimicrobiales bacterium]
MNEDRIPVVVAAGQVLERDEPVTALDLAERAAAAALVEAPALRGRIDRVSVVGIISPIGPAPAAALAARLGIRGAVTETTTIGGNSPQMLVTRAARDVAAGRLAATLIAGAESMRSARSGHRRVAEDSTGPPDPVVGDARPGVGPAESALGLVVPVHLYAMFESAIAAQANRSHAAHRAELGRLLAPFTATAAAHPTAWFRERLGADGISTPTAANRIVAEPYTKRMAAFLYVDQGAALLLCSLAAARAAGVADRAVFVWAGAACDDVWAPVARPALGRSPGIAAAAGATLAAAGVGIDDVAHLDLYSCFPAAVSAACRALSLAPDDPRGLTVTGGLPYFGGPGNNYSTHAIATLTDRLRHGGTGLGLVGALGWYTTKHAYGLYGAAPPERGFVAPDTSARQRAIDATALPVALGVDRPNRGTVAAATVVYDRETVSAAPVVATVDD